MGWPERPAERRLIAEAARTGERRQDAQMRPQRDRARARPGTADGNQMCAAILHGFLFAGENSTDSADLSIRIFPVFFIPHPARSAYRASISGICAQCGIFDSDKIALWITAPRRFFRTAFSVRKR